MPIYEFKCTKCQTNLEYRLPHEAAPKIGSTVALKCINCAEKSIKRVLCTPPAIKMGACLPKKQAGFDGFGWHDGLNMSFKGPKDYRDHLKREGLIEMGDAPPPQKKEVDTPLIDDETLKELSQSGLKVSDNEAKALKSGEYMKTQEFKNAVAELSANTNG